MITLSELTNSIGIQGNVDIRILDESNEVKETLCYETKKLSCDTNDLKDLENFVVTNMYSYLFKKYYPNHIATLSCLVIEIKNREMLI